MNGWDIAILLTVAGAALLAVLSIRKRKGSGCSCGCDGCMGCNKKMNR